MLYCTENELGTVLHILILKIKDSFYYYDEFVRLFLEEFEDIKKSCQNYLTFRCGHIELAFYERI